MKKFFYGCVDRTCAHSKTVELDSLQEFYLSKLLNRYSNLSVDVIGNNAQLKGSHCVSGRNVSPAEAFLQSCHQYDCFRRGSSTYNTNYLQEQSLSDWEYLSSSIPF